MSTSSTPLTGLNVLVQERQLCLKEEDPDFGYKCCSGKHVWLDPEDRKRCCGPFVRICSTEYQDLVDDKAENIVFRGGMWRGWLHVSSPSRD